MVGNACVAGRHNVLRHCVSVFEKIYLAIWLEDRGAGYNAVVLFGDNSSTAVFVFGVKQAPQTLWQISSAICVGFICSGIAFVWNLKVLDAAGSIIASSALFLVPIVSIVLGVTFLGESVTWNDPFGCAIVLFGAAVSQGRIKLKRTAQLL